MPREVASNLRTEEEFEPPHDKTNEMTVHPAKTQIRSDCAPSEDSDQIRLRTQRRLRSAWASAQSAQSLLWAQWVAKDPSFLHADSEDSDETGRMPGLI